MTTQALVPRLTFDRYCDEIVAQAEGMREDLAGADLRSPVPSCPGWNLAQLTQHVGEELPWLEGMVRARATAMHDDTAMRDLPPEPSRDAKTTGDWIARGAASLAEALREAGPNTAMWTPVPGHTVMFFARRFAHEILVHRIDAATPLGIDVEIEPDLALDGLAEWMELGALPMMLDFHPHRRALLGPGRTLRFVATDAEGPDACWLVDLTGELMQHQPAVSDLATVEVRGPLTSLLLFLYARGNTTELTIQGDRALLDQWHGQVAFA